MTVPEETALALYCFDTFPMRCEAVPVALDYDVSAVELMDDEVFGSQPAPTATPSTSNPIPEGTDAALLLEFDSELHDDFEAAIDATTERFIHDGAAFEVVEAYTDADQADIWKLRKAAIPLLMSWTATPNRTRSSRTRRSRLRNWPSTSRSSRRCWPTTTRRPRTSLTPAPGRSTSARFST